MSARHKISRFTRAKHRERWLAALTTRWQRRALFVLGGVLVGCAAVAFAWLADVAQRQFAAVTKQYPLLPLAVTPIGFCLVTYAAARWFQNAQGSGIPQTIAAYRIDDNVFRKGLLSLRVAIGKILLTVMGLLFGASTGREGPTVQVGASLMWVVGRLSPRHQSGLIVAGAAAGVAAAFNTPLAGIMFGIEEMSRSFERHTSGFIIACVIAAGFTALSMLGNYTYFGVTTGSIKGWAGWWAVPVCGVLGGLLGGLFSRLLIASARGTWKLSRWQQSGLRGQLGVAFGCGLVVAVCGVLSHGAVHGTGYLQVKEALDHRVALADSFTGLKFIATLVSSFSGIPGGIFASSLAIGAGIGSDLTTLFTSNDIGVMMLLGMVAYLAGVVQAPITAFVIVMEMTNDHAMLMPLMATALIACAVSRVLCREGIYHALASGLIERRRRAELNQPA